MGIFGDKKPQEDKDKEIFNQFGLDIENYDEKAIKDANVKNLKQIASDLAGKSWMKAGMALSLASADKQATVGYLSAIFNSNLIMIRQNELIIRALEKIANK